MTEPQPDILASLEDPLVGQLFEGRYQILSVIGQGGMGTVYKARHVHMDKIYAIKTLVSGAVKDETSFKRFEQEARAAASLSHPNTIAVTDFGRSQQGLAFLVMEYLSGKTLEDMLVEAEEPISLERFGRIFSQVCDGMQHAHKKGIIHRDIKPSNLMLLAGETDDGEEDVVKIVDFGLAKLSSSGDSQHLTQTGMVMGSPPYMSPEQCRGDELDSRSDIYSLGCVMYASLTGQVPLKGGNSMATIFKHISDLPVPISRIVPHFVHPLVESVVMSTLEKDPAKRPQSMAQLGARIKEAVAVARQEGDASANSQAQPEGQTRTRPVRAASNLAPGTNFPEDMAVIKPLPKPVQLPPKQGNPPVLVPWEGTGPKLAALPSEGPARPDAANAGVARQEAAVARGADAAGVNRPRKTAAANNERSSGGTPVAARLVLLLLGLGIAGLGIASFVSHHSGDANPSAKAGAALGTGSASDTTAEQSSTKQTGQAQAGTQKNPDGRQAGSKTAAVPAANEAKAGRSSASASFGQPGSSLTSLQADKNKASSRNPADQKRQAMQKSRHLFAEGNAAASSGNYSGAFELFLQCLKQEELYYGAKDPHLLKTLARVSGTARKANRADDTSHLTQALEIFDNAEEQSIKVVNATDNPSAIWRQLASACLDMAGETKGQSRFDYAAWADDFYELAYEKWKHPRNDDYYKMLHSYLRAASMRGDMRTANRLQDEIMKAGKYTAAELDGIAQAGNSAMGSYSGPNGYAPSPYAGYGASAGGGYGPGYGPGPRMGPGPGPNGPGFNPSQFYNNGNNPNAFFPGRFRRRLMQRFN